MTKIRGTVVSVAPVVGAVILSGFAAGPALADTECGLETAGPDTITCNDVSYGGVSATYPDFPNGITYTASDGLILILDDPAITVGSPGVSVSGSSSLTGDIAVFGTSFDTIITNGASGISANMLAGGSGSVTAVLSNGAIETEGRNATGVISTFAGTGDGDMLVQMDGGVIITNGLQANGIQAFQDRRRLNVPFPASEAIDATRNVIVRMTGGRIELSGWSSDGLTAVNRASRGDLLIEMTGGSIILKETSGIQLPGQFGAPPYGISGYQSNAGADGISAADGSVVVRMSGGEIISQAQFSSGILADNKGLGSTSIEVSTGATIRMDASDANGLEMVHSGEKNSYSILIDNGAFVTGGYGSGKGIFASSANDGRISIGENASLGAYSDMAVVAFGGAATLTNNGSIFGTVFFADQDDTFTNASSNSWNIRNFADTNGDLVRDEEAVAVSDFGGGTDTFSNTGTVRLLTVEDMSGFTAGADDDSAPVNWDTTTTAEYFPDANAAPHPSAMLSITEAGVEQGHLVNLERFENAGLITMADAETGGTGPVAGDVLVITGGAEAGTSNGGQFVSNGGGLHIDTVLNDGAVDITDVLVVDQAVLGTGATGIVVTNSGGTGASTDLDSDGVFDADEGILVVQALESGDAGAFELASPVAAGAYEYLLDQTDGLNWYLHSVFSSSARVYEAAPYVLLDGVTRMATLEQRVGQRRWNSATGTLEPTSGGWVRMSGDWSEAELGTGTSYDADSWGLQAGFDLPTEAGANGQWVLGLTAQTGKTSANIATMTGTGAVSADSLGFGATATWYGHDDLYVDLQGQVNWAAVDYSSSLHGQLADDELARTAAASIEVGRRFALDANAGLIPQAQLTWASVDAGRFTDSAGNAIDLGTTERVTGRLGVAYDYEWRSDDGASLQNIYAIANVLHDFSSDASVGVAGATLASDREATWGEIGLGGSVTWDETTTFYAEASYREAFGSGAGSGVSINAGLRVQW